ncbi:MAG: hypothetical protein AAB664_00330 [Patescibacteria group bacterium]
MTTDGTFPPSSSDTNITKTFSFSPSAKYIANTLYRVTLKKGTGAVGIKSEDGALLQNDITWTFKTKDIGCTIGALQLNPSNTTATEQNQLVPFTAQLVSS